MNKLRISIGCAVLAVAMSAACSWGQGIAIQGGLSKGRHLAAECGNFYAYPGDQLLLAGTIASMGAPFQDQMPDNRFEFTFVLRATLLNHFVGEDLICSSVDYLEYVAATVEIYKDGLKDADWEYPETFANGRRILEADVSNLVIMYDWPCYDDPYGTFQGDVAFTGGILFDRVSKNGVGYAGKIGTDWDFVRGQNPCVPPGYFGDFEFTMTVELPVSASETTWGRLKRVSGS